VAGGDRAASRRRGRHEPDQRGRDRSRTRPHGLAIYSTRLTSTPAGPAVSRPDLRARVMIKTGQVARRCLRKRRPGRLRVSFCFREDRRGDLARAGRSIRRRVARHANGGPGGEISAGPGRGQLADHRSALAPIRLMRRRSAIGRAVAAPTCAVRSNGDVDNSCARSGLEARRRLPRRPSVCRVNVARQRRRAGLPTERTVTVSMYVCHTRPVSTWTY